MSYNSITENDYGFVQSNSSELYGIKLKSGKWKDVIITYGRIKVKENKEADIATLQFEYNINDTGKFQNDELVADENFKNYLGDILSHIIDSKDDLEKADTKVEE